MSFAPNHIAVVFPVYNAADDGADALVICGNAASGLGARGPALSRTQRSEVWATSHLRQYGRKRIGPLLGEGSGPGDLPRF